MTDIVSDRKQRKCQRYDIYKRIYASYYGYRDDEDGILEKLEGLAEDRMRAEALADWIKMEEIKKESNESCEEWGGVNLWPFHG